MDLTGVWCLEEREAANFNSKICTPKIPVSLSCIREKFFVVVLLLFIFWETP